MQRENPRLTVVFEDPSVGTPVTWHHDVARAQNISGIKVFDEGGCCVAVRTGKARLAGLEFFVSAVSTGD